MSHATYQSSPVAAIHLAGSGTSVSATRSRSPSRWWFSTGGPRFPWSSRGRSRRTSRAVVGVPLAPETMLDNCAILGWSSLWAAQLRSTTCRPFAQWNLILGHLQHSKFNISIRFCAYKKNNGHIQMMVTVVTEASTKMSRATTALAVIFYLF